MGWPCKEYKGAHAKKVSQSLTSSWLWGTHRKIYSECMGKIVILVLDNSRKVDILKFL